MARKRFRPLLVVALVLAAPVVLAGRGGRLLSLCVIAEQPERYDRLFLLVRATFYGYSTGVMHINGSECDPGGNAWATVVLDDSFELRPESQALLESIAGLNSRREYVKAEVMVAGKIEDLKRRCFAPQFIMYVTRLEQLTPASVMQFPVDED